MHSKGMLPINHINKHDAILKVVSKIPSGRTLSYKEVAKKSGYPKCARLVGYLMANNNRKDIPCHRVVKSSGEVGDYNRGKEHKVRLLKKEGVALFCRSNGRCVVQ